MPKLNINGKLVDIDVDGKTIVTGSYNFTKAADESNAENVSVSNSISDIFSTYGKNAEVSPLENADFSYLQLVLNLEELRKTKEES